MLFVKTITVLLQYLACFAFSNVDQNVHSSQFLYFPEMFQKKVFVECREYSLLEQIVWSDLINPGNNANRQIFS